MADDIIEGTHPTRMELLQVKNKLRLAEKGHRLLKEKRDTLVMEFMNLTKEAVGVDEAASEHMKKARHAYAISSAVAGSRELMSAAMASEGDMEADVEFRNVMGIQLPAITLEERLRQIDQRGFGIISTDPTVDTVAGEYERAIQEMVKLAETEYSMLALSGEVKKTRRRVNALEYKVIPQLRSTQKYIRMRLDEMEREGFYRRKLVKKKKGGRV
ncbi:MAG: V-type ATP synthase subunit D [Candidatus Altiarchaeota archaeon]